MARHGNQKLGCYCLLLCCCTACPEILLALIASFVFITLDLNKDHIPLLKEFLEDYFYKAFGKTATNIMLPIATLVVFASWCFIRACCSTSCIGSTLLCGLGDCMRPHQESITSNRKDYGATSPASPSPIFIDESEEELYKIIPLTKESLDQLYQQLTNQKESSWNRCNYLFDFIIKQIASLVLLSSNARSFVEIVVDNRITLAIPKPETIKAAETQYNAFILIIQSAQNQESIPDHLPQNLISLIRENADYQQILNFSAALCSKIQELFNIFKNQPLDTQLLWQQIVRSNRFEGNQFYEACWNTENAQLWVKANLGKFKSQIMQEMANAWDIDGDRFKPVEYQDDESDVEGAGDSPLSPSTSRDPLIPDFT